MLEVLLARIASGLHIESSLLKVENFKSGISGIASTTRSQSDRDSRSTDEEILENAESASSRLIRSFETSFSREFDIAEVPLSRNSCLISTIVTSIPQQAATCAIPLPICPEPTTPTDRIAMGYSSSGGVMRFGLGYSAPLALLLEILMVKTTIAEKTETDPAEKTQSMVPEDWASSMAQSNQSCFSTSIW